MQIINYYLISMVGAMSFNKEKDERFNKNCYMKTSKRREIKDFDLVFMNALSEAVVESGK